MNMGRWLEKTNKTKRKKKDVREFNLNCLMFSIWNGIIYRCWFLKCTYLKPACNLSILKLNRLGKTQIAVNKHGEQTWNKNSHILTLYAHRYICISVTRNNKVPIDGCHIFPASAISRRDGPLSYFVSRLWCFKHYCTYVIWPITFPNFKLIETKRYTVWTLTLFRIVI